MLAFWILDPLYNALGGLLAAFYSVIPHYGLAIILLTASVSLIRMPLVSKQVKSQQEMQRIQPEIKRIHAKYKSDPQKRNEELMRVYKEHNVNPLASCLPLLLQMPLFIVLYRLIIDLSAEPPKHLPQPSRLFDSLVEDGGRIPSFGMDLARRASDMSGGELVPMAILIVLVVATGFYQTRQMQARLPKDAVNPQMAMVGKVFPVMFGVISFTIPAGVVLYFVVSNIWQIGQQAYMYRHVVPPSGEASRPKADDSAGTDGRGAKSTEAKGDARRDRDRGRGGERSRDRGRSETDRGRASGGSSGNRKPSGRTTPPKGAPAKGSSAARRGGRPPAPGRYGRTSRNDGGSPKGGSGNGGANGSSGGRSRRDRQKGG